MSSFLFHSKTKKAIQWAWGLVAVLIIISMVVMIPGIEELIARWFISAPAPIQ